MAKMRKPGKKPAPGQPPTLMRELHVVVRAWPDPTPIAGAEVRMEGWPGNSLTNAAGWVSFQVPAHVERVSFFVKANGFQPKEIHEFQIQGRSWRSPDDIKVPMDRIVVAPVRPVRSGLVKSRGKALVDDGGPFLTIGATMFWLPWGLASDRARTEKNLKWLVDHGVTVVRILCVVGEGGKPEQDTWYDRTIDPRASTFEAQIRETFLVLKQYGLRAIVTILGGIETLPAESDRVRVVEQITDIISDEFEEQVLYVEVSNENKVGPEEGKRLAQMVRDRTPCLVAITRDEFDGGTLDVLHTERKVTGDGGIWDHTEQGYDFRNTPNASSNQEPIGPKSSGQEDDDPERLAAAAACSMVCGASVYVFHMDAGIRGGGEWDVSRAHPGQSPRRRRSNFWEIPTAELTLKALTRVAEFYPADVSDFGRVTHSHPGNDLDRGGAFPWKTGPLQPHDPGKWFLKIYACKTDARFAGVILGIKQDVPLEASVPMSFSALHILSGSVAHVDLKAGERYIVRERGAVAIEGEFK